MGALSTTTTSYRGYCCSARRLRHFFICSGRSRVQTTTLMKGAPASSAARSRRNGHAAGSAARPLPVSAAGAGQPGGREPLRDGPAQLRPHLGRERVRAIPSGGSVTTQTPTGSVCSRARIQARP